MMDSSTSSRGTMARSGDSEFGRVANAFRQWRGERGSSRWDEAQHGEWEHRDIPGFCKSETIAGIGKHGFVLTPGRYVGAEEHEDDGKPFTEKYPRLLADLEDCFGKGDRLMGVVRERLARVEESEGIE